MFKIARLSSSFMKVFTGAVFPVKSRRVKKSIRILSSRSMNILSFGRCNYSKTRLIAVSLLVAILFSIGAKFSASSIGQNSQLFNQICTVAGIQSLETLGGTPDGDRAGDVPAERPCEFCFSQTAQYFHPTGLTHSDTNSYRSNVQVVKAKDDQLMFLVSNPEHAPPYLS